MKTYLYLNLCNVFCVTLESRWWCRALPGMNDFVKWSELQISPAECVGSSVHRVGTLWIGAKVMILERVDPLSLARLKNRWTGSMKVLSDNIQHSDRKEFRWSWRNEGTGVKGLCLKCNISQIKKEIRNHMKYTNIMFYIKRKELAT